MAHDVFVSHSTSDAQVALAIVNALESNGIRCWIAPRDIQGGQIWAEAIMAGIEHCRAMIVVFSSSANRSAHVLTEVDTAVRQGCIVVPFRIEAVDPEGALAYHLRTRHWLDALTPQLAGHIRDLVETMRRLLQAAPDPPGPRSQPWLQAASADRPPLAPPPALPKPVPFWRRRSVLIAAATVLLMGAGALLMSLGARQGSFVIRDASVADSPVSLPVRVTAIKFFEGPNETPAVDQREHATSFTAGSARYIYVQLDLSHGKSPREVRVPISCTITDGQGAVLTTITATGRIQPEWEGSTWASGWGTQNGGSWHPGSYTADCSYGGESIAVGRFAVVEGGDAPPGARAERVDPALPELNGRVSGLRFFPDFAGPLTPLAERDYATSFSAKTLQYLGVELELDYPAPNRKVALEGLCQITTGDGGDFGTVTVRINPEPTWTGSFSAGSFGWAEAGRWKPGSYLVSCRVNGRLVAQGTVSVR